MGRLLLQPAISLAAAVQAASGTSPEILSLLTIKTEDKACCFHTKMADWSRAMAVLWTENSSFLLEVDIMPLLRVHYGLGIVTIFILASALFCGCGNSDGSVTLNQIQTAELVKLLGTYEGDAHPRQIMGAMMTGIWTVTFSQDDAGALKCKCTLRLHDEQNGWGSPTTATADVKLYKGPANGEYSLKAEGQFSDSEPQWMITVGGISLTTGHAINKISLFDMDSYEITLSQK